MIQVLRYYPGLMAGFLLVLSIASHQGLAQVTDEVVKVCKSLRYSTEPALPTKKGDSLHFKIYVHFPFYPFKTNTQITIVPEIHFNNQVTALQPMRFKALPHPEKDPELTNDNVMALIGRGGNYHFEHEVVAPYREGMEHGTLEARITLIEGQKSQELPLVRMSQAGFSTFTRLLEKDLELMDMDCERENLCVKSDFVFYYPSGNSDNEKILNPEVLNRMLELLRGNRDILEIQIHSNASPEGESSLNENLAFKRMEETNKLIVRELMLKQHRSLTASDILNGDFIVTQWSQSNWKSLVKKINFNDFPSSAPLKDLLESDSSDAFKTQQVVRNKKFSDYLQKVLLPSQRYTRVSILSTPSDDKIVGEIQAFVNGNSNRKISCNRLIQMGMSTDSDKDAKTIYLKAVEWYPDDYKAYFKLGRIHYQEQRYEDAELSFLQASQLNPKSAEAKNNLAVSQAHLGKFREAYKNLESASTLQRGSFVNQAYVYAQLGKFNEALEKAPHTASNNRAVCQLVLGQPYEALETLEKVAAPSALTLYLHAIAATYLNDIGLMCQKLGECISMDAAFRDKARKEAEFNPYRQNEQFRSALKLPSGLQPSQN